MLLMGWRGTRASEPEQYGLSPNLYDAGWIALFDGHSLFGWQATTDANWQVADGTITVSQGEDGFLQTTSQFGDFELQLEYRCPPHTNSGVFLRSARNPTDPTSDCYEVNIAPADNPFPTGSLVARQKSATPVSDGDDWHRMSIRAQQGQFQVRVDGQLATEYSDDRPLGRGHIGLQFRGDPISFRHIRLRPLSMKPLFNSVDLDGWNTAGAQASRFFVENGVLRVLDGRGQLETTRSYGDFTLQLLAKTLAPGLNSGIFFRCIPGDEMMGYESQIHNGYADNDPARPIDCGTGGIFRRQERPPRGGRRLEWFAQDDRRRQDRIWPSGSTAIR